MHSTYLNYLTRAAAPHRGQILLLVAAGVLRVAVSLAIVWAFKLCMDVATGDVSGSLLLYVLLLAALGAGRIFLNVWSTKLSSLTEVRVANAMRAALFSDVLYTRWEELSGLRHGDVLTRLIKDTDDIIKTLVVIFPELVTALLELSGAFVLLLVMDWKLALAVGVILPILLLLSRPYWIRMKQFALGIKTGESAITTLMEDSLQHRTVVQAYGRQAHQLDRLNGRQHELTLQVRGRTRAAVGARLLLGLTFTGGYIGAFIRGVYGIQAGVITFGTVTALLQLVNHFQRPLFELMRTAPSLIASHAAVTRLTRLSGMPQEERLQNQTPHPNITALKAQNVTFTYADGRDKVLNNLSLEASRGEMIAVMGATGAGKTTFIRLLLALLSPQEGALFLEDASGRRIPLDVSTRADFVYVPQGNTLFSGTIRSNLLVGNPEATEEQMQEALRIARARFVLSLPEGLDTPVGSSGTGLSEGQAQRVAIARALLRPGSIFLFDEATSALDERTEAEFLTELKAVSAGKIILFITHHPGVAAHCNRIYSLHE